MLAIERRREIIAKLTLDGKVIVSELAREFGVTEETIRRDLEKLDQDGLASKTHGGAVSKHSSALDLPYNVREGVNVVQKQMIADKLAELIEDGERIAQISFVPYAAADFNLTDELSDTVRGEGGFGSTGKK